jgi:hypothetical protein
VLFSYLSIKTGVCPAYCQLYVRRRGAASLFLRRNSVYVFFLPILFDFPFSFFFLPQLSLLHHHHYHLILPSFSCPAGPFGGLVEIEIDFNGAQQQLKVSPFLLLS